MELTLEKASWNCPSIEDRKILTRLNQKKMAAFADPDQVMRMVEDTAKEQNESRYILPVWQNMESIALGTKILNNGKYMIPGRYCVDSLESIRHMDFSIIAEPVIQTTLDVIPHFKGRPFILEIEAPFSVLSAVMNPMDLYVCFMTEEEAILDILHKIADAQAEYVSRAVALGARVISLADPVGTMNMTGETYYHKFCGESEAYFMGRIDGILDSAIVHICKKMSQSLVIGGFATMESYELPGMEENYYDILLRMAVDPQIHFTGMTCIHHSSPNLRRSFALQLKK